MFCREKERFGWLTICYHERYEEFLQGWGGKNYNILKAGKYSTLSKQIIYIYLTLDCCEQQDSWSCFK